jgi:hypothetical protein
MVQFDSGEFRSDGSQLAAERVVLMIEKKTSMPVAAGNAQPERRRTQRVRIAMAVLVRAKSGNHSFEEETQTVSVNAHGCMVRLAARVTRDQHISIVNPKTAEELPCTVTFIGQADAGKMEVGIEFDEPSPRFWRIAFPPTDWDPSERKRAAAPHPSAEPQR